MGNRSSESLKDKPDELEIDDLGRHSKSDLDVLYRIPDLEKSLLWRLTYDLDDGALVRLRILDDSEPGVDMYEGVRPLICVETIDSWPEAVGFLNFNRDEQETSPTTIIFSPALKIKLTEEGKKVKEAERSSSTVCTWHVITAPSVHEMNEKRSAFMDIPLPSSNEFARKTWPSMAFSIVLSRRS